MSTHRRLTLAVLVAAGAAWACQEKIVNVVSVAQVDIACAGAPLLPGGTVQLTATPRDDRSNTLSNRSVNWSSSNSGVAIVSGSGLVSATAAGSATISASIEGVSGSTAVSVNNPVPSVASVSPDSVPVGSTTVQLTVTGTSFVQGAVVLWNGADRTTQFVSATSLRATLSAADLAATGSFSISVRNPAPGGGTSGTKACNVVNPVPVVTALAPATAIVGSGVRLTLTGTGFVRCGGLWSSASRSNRTVSASTLGAHHGRRHGDAGLTTVRNPEPGGGTSGATSFYVLNPVPVLTELAPASMRWVPDTIPLVGAQLTVQGTGFVAGSVVRLAGVDRATFRDSSTSLRALISTADLARPGLLDVMVINPAPGGGESAVRQFVVSIEPPGPGMPGPVISARRYSTCAVRGNGEAYCWGRNDTGQLGDGTSTDRTTPTRVATTIPFVSIGTGAQHACGLTSWGAAYCWGSGAIGASATSNSSTPVPVAGGHPFIQLSAGGWHTCGVTSDGSLYCWGDNYAGRLGDGTTTSRQTPVQVGTGTAWLRVFAGDLHTCGITSARRLYAEAPAGTESWMAATDR
jgi:hypothetical protein